MKAIWIVITHDFGYNDLIGNHEWNDVIIIGHMLFYFFPIFFLKKKWGICFEVSLECTKRLKRIDRFNTKEKGRG